MALTFDEALSKRVGQFGRGQWLILCASSLCLIANATAFFFWTFAAGNPVATHQWACDDPADTACKAVWQQDAPSNLDFCSLPAASWHWTSQDTLVARFDLVCGQAWKVQVTNSLMFVGALVGSGAFGFLCDRWGRRRPLFIATAIVAAAMFASLAAGSSYWVFVFLRVVTGFGAAGQSHCNFLLSTEPVGPNYRGLASICALAFFIVGEFVMVALGFGLPAWQHLLIACGCINAVTLLLYFAVPESGRWLLSQGRTEEAKAFLERLAKANRSQMPDEPLVSSQIAQRLSEDDMDDVEAAVGSAAVACDKEHNIQGGSPVDGSMASSSNEAEVPVSLAHLLRSPRLAQRLFILLITSFTIMLNYYGISMGAGGIPGPIYMTFAIGAAAEAFAVMVVAPSVDRLGRHNIVAIGQLLGGAACLACANVAGGYTQAALAAVGKFGCACASSVSNIYIAELLPTSCRSSVMGICSQASRVGSIAAPFLLMMGTQVDIAGHSQVFIPFTVFGCLAILSGLLVMLMPETLGAGMPERVEDLTALLSAFTAKPWRQGGRAFFAFVFRTRAWVASRRQSRSQVVVEAEPSRAPSTSSGSSSTGDAEAHIRVTVTPSVKAAASKTLDDVEQTAEQNS